MSNLKRKIGVDLGKARIGIALSDPLGILASAYTTLIGKGLDEDVEQIVALVLEKDADTVVLGLPLAMDGTDSDMTVYAREFAQKLKEKTTMAICL